MAQASFYCPQCQQMKLFVGENMNHTAHILASIFLCGSWLPIYILLALTYQPTYRCNNCGYTDSPRYLSNPNLRAEESKQAAAAKHALQYKIANTAGWTKTYYQLRANQYFPVIVTGAVLAGLLMIAFAASLVDDIKKSTERSIQTAPATPVSVAPEPQTPAELLARAKGLTGASYSPSAVEYLKQIPKNAPEYAEAQKLLKAEEEKRTLKKR